MADYWLSFTRLDILATVLCKNEPDLTVNIFAMDRSISAYDL